MQLYFILYTFFIAWFLVGHESIVRKYEKFFLLIACAIVWVVVSLSHDVGPDYQSYKFMYDRLNENFFKQEYLFRMSGYLFRYFSLSYEWFYSWITSVYLLFIFYCFFKYRNFTPLNFLIFIVMPYGLIEGGFNYIRQNVALGLFYFSLIAIINKKSIKYFLLNLIGFLFHKSAILLLPLYFVLNKTWKKKHCVTIFIVVLFATLSLNLPIVRVLLIKILTAIPLYGSTYAEFRDGAFIEGLSVKGIASYVYQLIPLLLLLIYKDRIVSNKIENVLFNITYLSLLTLTIAVEVRIMLRLEYYFVFAKVFTLPLLLRLCPDRKSRTISFFIMLAYFSLYIIALYLTLYEKNLAPYQSILG